MYKAVTSVLWWWWCFHSLRLQRCFTDFPFNPFEILLSTVTLPRLFYYYIHPTAHTLKTLFSARGTNFPYGQDRSK